MLLDFEKGVITSFEHVWPNTVVKCCFFHLTQNIWRHVQSVGLQSAYTHDEELARAGRLHMSPDILCEVEEAALHYCVRPDMLKAGNHALLKVQEHLLRLGKWTQ
ncbi:hypothetical protein LOD99_14330 [Oopsacas minuta]|uniref:MULE transposase domain-containing protein n=1 Tax=Oopsacas minuta TaxID=111878 RepID=A0AAV7KII1_9METZ|nr:hypothetical protein LOD99_14330 [Oopsacas minuta]